MKKNILLIIVLMGCILYPTYTNAKELPFNRESEKKQIFKRSSTGEDEWVYEEMISYPEPGAHPTYAVNDDFATVLGQKWYNATDKVTMSSSDTFEAGKVYEYRMAYQTKRAVLFHDLITYNADYPYQISYYDSGYFWLDGKMENQYRIYLQVRLTPKVEDEDPEFEETNSDHMDIGLPQLGATPPMANINNPELILEEKWFNATDNVLMQSTDVFQANKMYEYQLTSVDESMGMYFSDSTIKMYNTFEDSPYLVGITNDNLGNQYMEHINKKIVRFYFGDAEDLTIPTESIVIANNNTPIVNQPITVPNITLGDHIDEDSTVITWYREGFFTDTKIEEGTILQEGDTLILKVEATAELGYDFAENFKLKNENKNKSLVKEADRIETKEVSSWSNDNAKYSYSALFKVLGADKNIGIYMEQYKEYIYPGDIMNQLYVYPDTPENQNVSWASSNEEVGVIGNLPHFVAYSSGTTTISATNSNNETATLDFTVATRSEAIVLEESEITMRVGETKKLNASVWPPTTTVKSLRIYTDNGNVSVDNDYNIHALSTGTTVIEIYAGDNYDVHTTCTVTVIDPIVAEELHFNKDRMSLTVGNSETLITFFVPSDTTTKTLEWTSTRPDIATVDENGKVTALQEGSTIIKATTVNNIEAICLVTVTEDEIESTISLNKSSTSIAVGEYETLLATINPPTNIELINWSSQNEEIATVNTNGKVTGISAGTTTIKAELNNGNKAECTVTVTAGTVEVESITLKSSTTIEVNQTEKLNATINPSNATNQTITWASNHPEIVNVDQTGTILGLQEGSATITASVANGVNATCQVTVTAETIAVESITLNKQTLTLEMGHSEQLQPTITPSTATNQTITWASSNNNIAIVDNNGTVQTISAGQITITATTNNGKQAICTVTVIEPIIPVESISLNKSELTLEKESSEDLIATVSPQNATNKKVTWTSSNPSIATVNTLGEVVGITEGETVITATTNNGKQATCNVTVVRKTQRVLYSTHVQSYGWQNYVSNGAMSGTSGQAKRLEAIKIKLQNAYYEGNILYRTHIQSYGWEKNFKQNDGVSGTSGEAKRLEAIEIKLDGEIADHYDVYYRVHAQHFGWLGWAKNGESAGTAGYAYRLEAIEIKLVEKSETFPEYGQSEAFKQMKIVYTTHVQTYGWQNYVADGEMAGTSGEAKRLEAIRIRLNNQKYDGDVVYKTHIQSYGWEKQLKRNDAISGTSGEGKRLEAIQIKLTGDMAEHHDIYYRVHAQSFGWLAWAKNGEAAGTAGYGKRLEGIEIVLVDKGEQPPARSNQNNSIAFIQG